MIYIKYKNFDIVRLDSLKIFGLSNFLVKDEEVNKYILEYKSFDDVKSYIGNSKYTVLHEKFGTYMKGVVYEIIGDENIRLYEAHIDFEKTLRIEREKYDPNIGVYLSEYYRACRRVDLLVMKKILSKILEKYPNFKINKEISILN